MNCEGYSYGCYLKILCSSASVCETWKGVNCGGKTDTKLLQMQQENSTGSQALIQRLGDKSIQSSSGLDGSLQGKCGF